MLTLVWVLTLTACGASAATTSSTTTSSITTSSTTTSSATTSVPPTTTSTTAPTTVPTTAPATTTPTTVTLPPGVSPPPDWLGTRPLDPEGAPFETPPELSDRRFISPDLLPPPPDDRFHSSIGSIPADVQERATWSDACPVALDDLAYVTVTFRGFDGLAHTGELIVADAVASDIVSVFAALYEMDFPIEEMRVTSPADLDAEPTGDGNSTAAFVCRPVTGGANWSEHAYGLAIDVNPFHNPYVRGDLVLPELATDYVDRSRRLPGMITDEVVDAFAAIGWEWGGHWNSLKDYQHFSLRGR